MSESDWEQVETKDSVDLRSVSADSTASFDSQPLILTANRTASFDRQPRKRSLGGAPRQPELGYRNSPVDRGGSSAKKAKNLHSYQRPTARSVAHSQGNAGHSGPADFPVNKHLGSRREQRGLRPHERERPANRHTPTILTVKASHAPAPASWPTPSHSPLKQGNSYPSRAPSVLGASPSCVKILTRPPRASLSLASVAPHAVPAAAPAAAPATSNAEDGPRPPSWHRHRPSQLSQEGLLSLPFPPAASRSNSSACRLDAASSRQSFPAAPRAGSPPRPCRDPLALSIKAAAERYQAAIRSATEVYEAAVRSSLGEAPVEAQRGHAPDGFKRSRQKKPKYSSRRKKRSQLQKERQKTNLKNKYNKTKETRRAH
eukprot:GHVT01064187.1.p1 GENE.GHVT01064187.1~~GHVT01064187.1.p1  ORF type:complete len:383 (-),score=75.88 GHVT01064187.1:429-1547(-)